MDYPSIWQEEKAPQPFAAGTELQRNESKTYEAVIVGAGMCGLLTAYRLLEKGVQSLAIVDAGELAGGVTARTTAKITSQHGLIYDRLLQGLGREKAWAYAQANQDAVEEFAALSQQFPCDFQRCASVVYAAEEKDAQGVERELQAALRVGLPAAPLRGQPLPFPVAAGVRFENQARFHPLKFAYALAACLSAKVDFYLNTTALHPRKGGTEGVLHTTTGTLHADNVVVASHFPFMDKPGFYFARVWQERSYVLALQNVPKLEDLYWGAGENGWSFRPYEAGLLVGGGSHKSGHEGRQAHFDRLAAVTKSWYPQRQITAQWSAQDCMTHDGIPYIGRYKQLDGQLAARKVECFSNQGAYASHGHSICAKAMGSFPQIYPCDNFEGDAWTVYTNRPAAGAMRGYGMPQASFADDANIDECAKAVGMDPLEYRMKYIMPKGFHDGFSGNTNYYDSFRDCLEKGKEYIEYDKKKAEYAKDTGNIRRGIGVAAFWYNTAVYPISLETSSNRMLLNLDGTVTMQCGETEIGQGADTAYAQMTAEAVGLKSYRDVRVVSCQDTDITPTGLGAYASRQTYVAGFSIRQTATLLRQKILAYATKLTRQAVDNMDIVDGNIVRKQDGAVLMSLSELAMTAQYNAADSEHITAESTYTIRNNAYSFGCTFADVEVDIALCKVKLNKIINVHDCGSLINPALAEAQVHGGMSMAIGYGMSEQLLFDEKTGKPLNNNLLDYKLSTFMDHPHLEAQFVENPEPTSPFGTKALGEPPACSGAPAIRNAILNATGVAIDCTPITPHVLFAEFSKAGLIHDSWNEKEGK